MNQDGVAPKSAIGGQANETGSEYRACFAAYVAAYALAGVEIPLIQGDKPVGPASIIRVESDAHVDDLEIEFDEAKWYVQCKSNVGKSALKETVAQWAKAIANGIDQEDRVLLATARTSGVAEGLQDGLERSRSDVAVQAPSGKQKEALDVMDECARKIPKFPTEGLARLRDQARVIKLDVGGASTAGFREAALVLERSVVEKDSGRQALEVLIRFFQSQASRRWTSSLKDWNDELLRFKLLTENPGTPSAAVGQLSRYRSDVAATANRIKLSFVSNDLPPFDVPDLAENLRASFGSDSCNLVDITRRWPRVLLVGGAGTGKSEALRQLAAFWAGLEGAPLPVLVPLRRYRTLRAEGERLTLNRVVEDALGGFGYHVDANLIRQVERLLRSGEAVLLLDGLDECGKEASWIIDEIDEFSVLLNGPPRVILSCRPTQLSAASRLELREFELEPPIRLQETMGKLIEHVASSRVGRQERDGWIRVRRALLDEVCTEHSALTSIPLMLTLITLSFCNDVEPAKMAICDLLSEVISSTVSLDNRLAGESEEGRAIIAEGFTTIGALLSKDLRIARSDATSAVSSNLIVNWDLAPAAANLKAESVVEFWDSRTGVFEEQEVGWLTPRSRVFVEIAAARWASEQTPDVIRAWVSEHCSDRELQDTLKMALEISDDVVQAVLDLGDLVGVFLIAEVASRGTPLDLAQNQQVLDLLTPVALGEVEIKRQPQGFDRVIFRTGQWTDWEACRSISQMKLPEELWPYRRSIIGRVDSGEFRTLATALTACSEIAVSGNEPTPNQVRELEALRTLGPNYLTGKADAVFGALDHVPIDHEFALWIVETSKTVSVFSHEKILNSLSERGHPELVKGELQQIYEQYFKGISNVPSRNTFYLSLGVLIEMVAELGEPKVLTFDESWRLPNLSKFLNQFRLYSNPVGELASSVKHESDELRVLVRTVIESDPDSKDLVVSEAASIRGIWGDDALEKQICGALFAVPRYEGISNSIDGATQNSTELLAMVRTARTPLVGRTALEILAAADGDELSRCLLEILDDVPRSRREAVAFFGITSASDPVAAAATVLRGADAITLTGVGMALLDLSGYETAELLSELASSEDLRARIPIVHAIELGDDVSAAVRDPMHKPPKCWSCEGCDERNDIHVRNCGSCAKGKRPYVRRETLETFGWNLGEADSAIKVARRRRRPL